MLGRSGSFEKTHNILSHANTWESSGTRTGPCAREPVLMLCCGRVACRHACILYSYFPFSREDLYAVNFCLLRRCPHMQSHVPPKSVQLH